MPQRTKVMEWRKAERQRLIAERLAMDSHLRRRYAEHIAATVEKAIGDVNGLIVSAYWPFRGEPDLREFMGHITTRGGKCALPVVVERAKPLMFRAWTPGDELIRGVWNIPVPAQGEAVIPDVVIAPVVGFDRACYRLGYGGGFFDRTLAAATNFPRKVGVGYAQQAIATVHPQPYDIPMDMVITEESLLLPEASSRSGNRPAKECGD